MLFLPTFDVPFGVHTGVSDYQIGVVITKYQKQSTLFFRKLLDTHKIYITTYK